jgi:hypothetical protein
MVVRLALAVAAILALANACALPAAPLLTDAERCARYGGGLSHGNCRTGP